VADRYQKFGCDFYLASYYHFSYLLNEDYEAGKKIMGECPLKPTFVLFLVKFPAVKLARSK
jgi:hypothetical protein